MKSDLINSGASKLDALHPRTVLQLVQELYRKDYHSAGVTDVKQTRLDKLNNQVEVTLSGFKNGNFKENHTIYFKCVHADSYSCSSYQMYSRYSAA